MPAPLSSLVRDDFALVRIRERVLYLRGRRLGKHGQLGSLVALPLADALRLVEAGQAKMPGDATRQQLREAVAALA